MLTCVKLDPQDERDTTKHVARLMGPNAEQWGGEFRAPASKYIQYAAGHPLVVPLLRVHDRTNSFLTRAKIQSHASSPFLSEPPVRNKRRKVEKPLTDTPGHLYGVMSSETL